MFFNQPSYNIISIKRGDCNYPASLLTLGVDAPETLYCIGNVSLLNKRMVLVVGTTTMNHQTVQKTDEMLPALSDYHIINMAEEGVEYYAQQSNCDVSGKSIILLSGTNNIDSFEYDDLKPLIDDVLTHEGLVFSLYNDDDFIDKYYDMNMVMLALSDVVGCLKGDKSTGTILNMANKIGKKVLQF